MPTDVFPRLQKTVVKRSELRQNQSKLLRQVRGRKVLMVESPSEDLQQEKYIVDKRYLDELVKSYSSLVETLEITLDTKLFGQILASAETLEQDLRRGRLHSFEEAFEEG